MRATHLICAIAILTATLGAAWAEDDPRSVIVGKVIDEAKKPIAGATVTAVGRNEGTPVKSSDDGSFRLRLTRPPREWIYATLLVQGPNGTLGFFDIQQSKPTPVEVVVRAPHEVAVRVLDNAGKPVADSAVNILAAYVAVASGRTDADGRWSARIPADAAKARMWAVYALKGKVGFDYVMSDHRPVDDARHVPKKIELKLDGARTVRVKAIDQSGKPLAGVEVGPWLIRTAAHDVHVNLGGAQDLWLKTDKHGIAVFDWMPARYKNQLIFISHSDRYYAIDHSARLEDDDKTGELTIELLPFERLSGRVTHADGTPAAGIAVRAQGQGAGHNSFGGTAKTDAEGRYSLQVHAEHAYVIAIADQKWAAPYKGGLVIRAGKPADGVDFVLGPATRVHGRVTVGKDASPVPDTQVGVEINLGQIPKDLVTKEGNIYRPIRMWISTQTDKDGRYELFLGPGDYELSGPPRTNRQKIKIPAKDQPLAIAHEFVMPRPDTGPLSGRVVDAKGKPVAGAMVEGYYAASTGHWFRPLKTDGDGKFKVTRSLDPLVLHARTPDGKEAVIKRIEAEKEMVELVLRPTVSASGRLLDLADKPIGGAKLSCGIHIYMGEEENSPFMTAFGGAPVSDADGKFVLTGLLPGERYHVSLPVGNHYPHVTEFVPKDTTPISLGELRVNTEPPKPYVPPTPAERAAKAFANPPKANPTERVAKLLVEARREYTRPLLLLGQPKDPACIELFRLFDERSDDANDKQPSPHSLRWEFELATIGIDQPAVRQMAEKLGVKLIKESPPLLAVLNADGSLAATHALSLNGSKLLDERSLTEFLLKHKLPQRDAQKMLDDALKTAKAEDKRVYFIASASWCGPCRMLGRFMDPFKTELNRHYVFVKIDISRDLNADSVLERFKGDQDGGVPWYAIVDVSGKVMITSNVPEVKRRGKAANMGFPTGGTEIEHFMKMLTQTAPRLEPRKTIEIREALSNKK